MTFENYIKPELLVLVPVLYAIGAMIKKSELIKNKYIPLTLGALGVALAMIYVIANEGCNLLGVFTAITQGVLIAGVTVYGNQVIKQFSVKE